ncbi:trichohyalin-like [Anoplophora glabripennis]|uniref:trichohyalin-like n=1 Tax=Anoplophora glabripennis TaxID=217634 RepID=UPI00087593A9|nr:trichohyalin-like [Anoplophora glabripennis]
MLREEAMKKNAKEEKKREQKVRKEREKREDEEEIEKRKQREEVRLLEDTKKTVRENMEEIRRQVEIVMTAANKESGSKLSFNRGDQTAVNVALGVIQGECMGFLVKQAELMEGKSEWQRKNEKLKEEEDRWKKECQRLEEERKVLEKKNRELVRKNRELEEELDRAKERRGSQSGSPEGREQATEVRQTNERAVKEVSVRYVGVRNVENEREELSEEESENEGELYAQVARRGTRERGRGVRGMRGRMESGRGRTQRGRVYEGGEGWSTPPKNLELIVTGENVNDGRKLAEHLAKRIDMRENGGAPRAVRVMREGRLCIVAKSEEQRARIEEQMKGLNGIDVRKGRTRDPMILVSGVPVAVEERELLEALRSENEELREGGMRIIKKYQCRNPWKRNWVVQMKAKGFREVIRKERVNVLNESLYVEEYVGTMICFKCCGFGHMAGGCKERLACFECGGEHEARECRSERRECVNCARMFKRKEEHGAKDAACPAYKVNLDLSRRYINYNV